MEKKTFKYVVSLAILVWDNSIDDYIEEESTDYQYEFLNENPLIARKMAFEKAEAIEEFYIKDFTSGDPLEYYTIPMIAEFKGDIPPKYIRYQTTIYFVHEGENYTIFDNGDFSDELMFHDLQEEYKILNKPGINLKSDRELVKYYDHLDKKNKQSYILSNGFEWGNPQHVNSIHSIDFDKFLDKDDQKQKRKKVTKKPQAEMAFKSTYKNRFNYKKSTIEISLKTTYVSIPPDIETAINKLIQQWLSKKKKK